MPEPEFLDMTPSLGYWALTLNSMYWSVFEKAFQTRLDLNT